ncbi:MAG: 4-(cytidine 5'-diphospho)-2-C-methyl-D-erythritol kinase, partial [Clostridia bacterium]|nr:4-(cytidine 5'-diphospho)-2-C-methyl-D-erythritol kinase [Clostridia bacterium]
ALSARMSGSGPSVYGLFDSKEKAQGAAEIIRADGAKAFVCETI